MITSCMFTVCILDVRGRPATLMQRYKYCKFTVTYLLLNMSTVTGCITWQCVYMHVCVCVCVISRETERFMSTKLHMII